MSKLFVSEKIAVDALKSKTRRFNDDNSYRQKSSRAPGLPTIKVVKAIREYREIRG